jgi:hypothetical protein
VSERDTTGGDAPGFSVGTPVAEAAASKRALAGGVRTVGRTLAVCAAPHHLRRTGTIGLVVGTWLTFMNHGDAIVHGAASWELTIKIGLNYLTPFVVSNLGLLSRMPAAMVEDSRPSG